MGRYVTLLLPPLAQPVPRVRGCVCVRVCACVCARAFPRSFARPHNGIRGGTGDPSPEAANLSATEPLARAPVYRRVQQPACGSGGTAQLSGSGWSRVGGVLLAGLRGCPGATSQVEGVRERTALPRGKAPPASFSE